MPANLKACYECPHMTPEMGKHGKTIKQWMDKNFVEDDISLVMFCDLSNGQALIAKNNTDERTYVYQVTNKKNIDLDKMVVVENFKIPPKCPLQLEHQI